MLEEIYSVRQSADWMTGGRIWRSVYSESITSAGTM